MAGPDHSVDRPPGAGGEGLHERVVPLAARIRLRPQAGSGSTSPRSLLTSALGGAPNRRLYSRLNWDGLS